MNIRKMREENKMKSAYCIALGLMISACGSTSPVCNEGVSYDAGVDAGSESYFIAEFVEADYVEKGCPVLNSCSCLEQVAPINWSVPAEDCPTGWAVVTSCDLDCYDQEAWQLVCPCEKDF